MNVLKKSEISYSGPYTIDTTGYSYSKTVSSANALSFTRTIDDCFWKAAPSQYLSKESEDNVSNNSVDENKEVAKDTLKKEIEAHLIKILVEYDAEEINIGDYDFVVDYSDNILLCYDLFFVHDQRKVEGSILSINDNGVQSFRQLQILHCIFDSPVIIACC